VLGDNGLFHRFLLCGGFCLPFCSTEPDPAQLTRLRGSARTTHRLWDTCNIRGVFASPNTPLGLICESLTGLVVIGSAVLTGIGKSAEFDLFSAVAKTDGFFDPSVLTLAESGGFDGFAALILTRLAIEPVYSGVWVQGFYVDGTILVAIKAVAAAGACDGEGLEPNDFAVSLAFADDLHWSSLVRVAVSLLPLYSTEPDPAQLTAQDNPGCTQEEVGLSCIIRK